MVKIPRFKFVSFIRILMIMMLIPLIAIGSVLWQSYNDINYATFIYNKAYNTAKETEFQILYGLIREKSGQAKDNTLIAKEVIEYKLHNEFSSDAALRYELFEDPNDNRAKQILAETIEGKYVIKESENDHLYIADKHGIYMNKNLADSVMINNKKWDQIINTSINPQLYKQARANILYKNINDLLIVDIDPSLYLNYNVSSEELLRNIYNFYGMDAMQSINILECSYIYDKNDMFGIPDIDNNGYKTDNNTLYIIQKFNVGDCIKEYKANYKSSQKAFEEYDAWLDATKIKIFDRMIFSSLIMLLSFVSLFSLIYVYLKWRHDSNDS